MRAKVWRDGLRIDLIHTDEELARVVRLVASTGLLDIRVSPDGEGDTIAVDVALPHGEWGATAFAGLLAITGEIEGQKPEQLLSRWRQQSGHFAKAAEAFHGTTAA